MGYMRISEMFRSIQGEGLLAGVVSGFIRTAGCNLRCGWCDTPYALAAEEGREVELAAIMGQVRAWECRHVVVTGGEPLIAVELPRLTAALREDGRHITVETNGLVYRPMECDLASLSPKLANALPGMPFEKRINLAALREFVGRHEYQFKFVVEGEADLEEIESLRKRMPGVERERVLLMPQARSRAEYQAAAARVAQWCIERGYRFGPRVHLEIWDNLKGK